ncbi:hypothetical protein H5410_007510 [Solanum commersonii]|uniref:Protein kinase domain-containing protein n=1 Tax=Solanum commersonii TaxID=4109 RepID=A0A9J6ADB5_SOLCO|nr:hypothetical protein H5410_007510 [Solanum commersonii]
MSAFHDFSISSFLLILVLCSLVQIIEAQGYSRLLPQQEKNALKEIAEQLGKKDWDFDVNPCNGNTDWITPITDKKSNDVSHNYLSGTIPPEWASIKLEYMSVMVNRLSGPIPKYLGNMTTLLYMSLENNMFNGTVPKELGNMVNLQTLILSYNNLTGKLPEEVNKLTKLTELRMSGNNFTGILPSFESLKNLQKLMLRNCNLSGEIPSYLANMTQLSILDLSLNRLEGQIPDLERLETFYIDLSNNNFNENSEPTTCQDTRIINWFMPSDPSFQLDAETLGNACQVILVQRAKLDNLFLFYGDWSSVHINCGGESVTIGDITYERKFNAVVEDGILELRFQYAGKGTTAVPRKGSYGPLISAISFEANSKPSSNHKRMVYIIAGALVLLFTIFFVAWRRSRNRISKEEELRGLDLLTGVFTIRQIKAATNNFDAANKIGEGGFGSVYKGTLLDGTVIAVKQLSSKSKQGNREFVNEIGMISSLQHPNLVKLYGCCAEGNQLLLVYEYLENNSLLQLTSQTENKLNEIRRNIARSQFMKEFKMREGPEEHHLQIDWPTRQKICIGIAKGLAFLHEESSLKIVHRDIKATNVLLDKKLNPKISDFGLAKLDDEDKTHISTRIAGTIGYMAPEYALWGYLTYKADVYSFGVVALEIVAGKNNMKYRPNEKFVCLLDWALVLKREGKLMELVDKTLSSDFKKDEALRMINVALLCTNTSPALRPTMSAVVSILEDHLDLPELSLESRSHDDDDELKFQGLRDKYDEMRSLSKSQTLAHSCNTIRRECSSTTSESG